MIFGAGKNPTRETIDFVLRHMPQNTPEDVFKVVEEAENRGIDVSPFSLGIAMRALRTHASFTGGGTSETALAILEKQIELAPKAITPFYVALVAHSCVMDRRYQLVKDLFAYARRNFSSGPHRRHYGYMLLTAYRLGDANLAFRIWKESHVRSVRLLSGPLTYFLRQYRLEYGEKSAARLLTKILPDSPRMTFVFMREATRIFYEMGDVVGLMEFVADARAHRCRPYLSFLSVIRLWHLMASGMIPSYKEFRGSNQIVAHVLTYEDLAREALANNRLDLLFQVLTEASRWAVDLPIDLVTESCKALVREGGRRSRRTVEYLIGTLHLQMNSMGSFEAARDVEAYREIMRLPVDATDFGAVIAAAAAGVRPGDSRTPSGDDVNDNDDADENFEEAKVPSIDLVGLFVKIQRKRSLGDIFRSAQARQARTQSQTDKKNTPSSLAVEDVGDGEELYSAPEVETFQLRAAHCVAALERVLSRGVQEGLDFYATHIPQEFHNSPAVAVVLMRSLNASLRFDEAAAVAAPCLQSGNVDIYLANELIRAWSPSKGIAAAVDLIVENSLQHIPETFITIFETCRDTKNIEYATHLASTLKDQDLPTYAPAVGAYLQLLASMNRFQELYDTFWHLVRRPQPLKWLVYATIQPIVESLVFPKLSDPEIRISLIQILHEVQPTPRHYVDLIQFTKLCNAVNSVAAAYSFEPQPVPERPKPVQSDLNEDYFHPEFEK